MSRLLLDTHLLLWAVGEPKKLPPAARKRIDDSEVFVSAASIWEVSIKAAIGKLAADPAELLAEIEPAGFRLLPVTGEHAAAVARLPAVHNDPFDRMLVALAIVERMQLVTADEAIIPYGAPLLWAGRTTAVIVTPGRPCFIVTGAVQTSRAPAARTSVRASGTSSGLRSSIVASTMTTAEVVAAAAAGSPTMMRTRFGTS